MTGNGAGEAILTHTQKKTNLFQFINDHSKGFEDGISRSSQSDNSLRTIPFWDVDTCTTLDKKKKQVVLIDKKSWNCRG